MNIGQQIGPYHIESLLGVGGMAEVYKAHNTTLQRHEALKALKAQLASDHSFVERFLNEARTVVKLEHPHIAAIYSFSEVDAPQPYFTMELVESGDLSDVIAARAPMSLDEALPILEQIASALDYAHAQGVLHRDIKPGNVLMKPNGQGGWDTKVVDFGIAKAVEEVGGTRLTRTGMIIGTPEYMSPEQGGSGAKVGAATDQYALGVIAYEMLCGVPPFKAQGDPSPISLIMQHVRDEPRAPIAHNTSLSKAPNNAILKALAKVPEQRFVSCREFMKSLGGTEVVVPPEFGDRSEDIPEKKWSPMPLLIGVGILAGVGLMAFGVVQNNTSTGPEQSSVPSVTPASTSEEITPVSAASNIEVPDLVGKTEKQAREIIEAKSLTANIVTGFSEAFSRQQVMSQYPQVGTSVTKGSSVTIRISVGAENNPVEIAPVPASAQITESQVSQVIADWLNSQNTGDFSVYSSLYAAEFLGVKRTNSGKHIEFGRRSWLADRSKMFGSGKDLNVSIDNRRVQIDGSSAVVNFDQYFRTNRYGDWGPKVIKIKATGAGAQIFYEEMISSQPL